MIDVFAADDQKKLLSHARVYFWGQLAPNANDIPDHSHGIVFRLCGGGCLKSTL